jgi:hypothetical protein
MMFSISWSAFPVEIVLGGMVGGGVVVDGGMVGGGVVVEGGIVGGGVVVNGGSVGGRGNVGVVNDGKVGRGVICAPLDCINPTPTTVTAPSPTTTRNTRRIPAPPRRRHRSGRRRLELGAGGEDWML